MEKRGSLCIYPPPLFDLLSPTSKLDFAHVQSVLILTTPLTFFLKLGNKVELDPSWDLLLHFTSLAATLITDRHSVPLHTYHTYSNADGLSPRPKQRW